jgi:hypothetical protein
LSAKQYLSQAARLVGSRLYLRVGILPANFVTLKLTPTRNIRETSYSADSTIKMGKRLLPGDTPWPVPQN